MQQMTKAALVTGIMLLMAVPSPAQKKKAITPAKHVSPVGLVPVYKTSLGNVLSNTLPVTMMKQLLDSTLIARDSTGQPHAVVGFDFGYSTTDTYYNDSTGAPNTSRLYSTFHFQGNRLDSVWLKGISEKIKPGDELYFEKVIAVDKKGLHYLSSALRFQIK